MLSAGLRQFVLFLSIAISHSSSSLQGEASLSFNSYTDDKNVISSPGDKKILIISLSDGTIMALDTASGAVLWSIAQKLSDFFNFISYCDDNCSTFFIPSTNGELYYLYEKGISLIKPDDFGHTFLDQQYYFQTSSVKVITTGINIVTGKPYFYISDNLCYRASNEDLKHYDHDNLLFIKQTTKVVQLFNVFSKRMVVTFHHGMHQVSSTKYMEEDSESGDFGGLSYDVDTDSLYGWGIDDQFNFVNCWKISLGAHILNAWKVVKTSTSSYVSPISLMNMMTTKSFNQYKISLRLAYIMNNNKQTEKCHDLYMFHTLKNTVYLQKIGQSLSNSACKNSVVIDPGHILSSEMLKRFSKFTRIENDSGVSKRLLDILSVNKILQINDSSEPNEKSKKWSLVKGFVNFLYTLQLSELFNKVRRSLSNIKIYNFFLRKEMRVLCVLSVIIGSIYAFWSFFRILYFHYRNNDPTLGVLGDTIINPIHVDLECRSENRRQPPDSPQNDFLPSLFPRYSNEFEEIESIGSGGYGVVFKSRNRMDNYVYAIKRVNLVDCHVARRKTMREVKALAHLNHPNIIRFHAAWFEESSFKTTKKSVENYHQNGKAKLENSFGKNPNRTNIDNSLCEDSDVVFEYSDPQNPKRELLWKDYDSESLNDTDSDKLSPTETETQDKIMASCILACHNSLCSHLTSIYLFIQMELCHKETLKSYLLKTQIRHTPTIISIFDQILSAVNYIHSRSLMHRDIKPSNIFFSFEGKVKLGDFGLVTNFNFDRSLEQSHVGAISQNLDNENTMTRVVGTELYMAPELLKNSSYDFKVDVYSLGMVLFELVVPFYTQCERSIVVMALREQMTFPTHCKYLTSDIVKVIKIMMSHNPDERPSISALLKMRDTQSILRNAAPPDISSKNILNSLKEMSTMHQYSDASY